MSTSPAPVFSGTSSYASDLQQVINRSIAIAAMPLQQLQSQLQTMDDQQTALGGLDTKFSALQTAVQKLETSFGTSSYSATSSNPTSISASVSSGALPASYTLDVTSIGSYSTAISDSALPAVSDPYSTSISSSNSFTLSVNGNPFQFTTSDGSLMGLAQAINASGAGVQASVVNTGSTAAPQYQLALQSSNLGPDSIQLNDGAQDLLASLNTGEYASYTVNGLNTPVQSNTRSITLSPGVTANLLQATPTGQPATITVSRSSNSLSDAMSAFVSAYNDSVDELDKEVGASAGALSGKSIVSSLYQSLSHITQFTASGAVSSIAQLGLSLDNAGHLSFDATTFSEASVDALQSFLGTSTTGGFLKNAVDTLNGVEDSTTGSVKLAIQDVNDEITTQNDRITTQNQRLDDLQTRLQAQMAAADALIASLESQRDYMTNLFTAMMNANNSGVNSK